MRHLETRKLLGTTIEIVVISEDSKTPDRIGYAFDYFESIEQEFSRFLPDSSLSLLNQHKKSTVSKRFIELMSLARTLHSATGGFFNPLVSVANLGYSQSFQSGSFEAKDGSIDTDFSKIIIEGNAISLQSWQSLDFGGIAKGWAVDWASTILRSFGYDDFFVNAGGDIFASGSNEWGEWWTIGIENPFTEEIIASIDLRDSAVATSGSYKRNWKIEWEQFHHLVNPNTGKNENNIVSVTLIAPKCIMADAFTKTVFNSPIHEGIRLIEQHGMSGLVFTSEKQLLTTKGLEEKYNFAFL